MCAGRSRRARASARQPSQKEELEERPLLADDEEEGVKMGPQREEEPGVRAKRVQLEEQVPPVNMKALELFVTRYHNQFSN